MSNTIPTFFNNSIRIPSSSVIDFELKRTIIPSRIFNTSLADIPNIAAMIWRCRLSNKLNGIGNDGRPLQNCKQKVSRFFKHEQINVTKTANGNDTKFCQK